MPLLPNPKHEMFAQAVARGISGTQAYMDCGYSKNGADVSAAQLLGKSSVRERVEEIRLRLNWKAENIEISSKEKRVKWLDDRAKALRQIITERAVHPDYEHVPGGKTGLIAKFIKPYGTEFQVDAAMLKEMRAHEEQAAKELGQWVEKKELSPKSIEDVPEETLRQWVEDARHDGNKETVQ